MSAYDNLARVQSDFWGAPVVRLADGSLMCPGFVGPKFASSPWDTVFFGGLPGAAPLTGIGTGVGAVAQTPGIAEVEVSKEQAIDVKKPAGSHGATLTLHGGMPGEVTIRVKLWTPEQYEAWKVLEPLLMPLAAKQSSSSSTAATGTYKPVPVTIQHPATQEKRISSVVVSRIEGPVPGPEPRTRVWTIRAIEFLPARGKATGTPKQSEPLPTTLDPSTKGPNAPKIPPQPGTKAANKGP